MKPILAAGLRYFLYFCLLYGTLTAISLIPQVGKICNSIYRQPTQSLLRGIFPQAYLKLTADPDNADIIKAEYASKKRVQEQWRTAQQNGQPPGSVQVRGKIYEFRFYNTFLSFYLFFVALMLLSPLPRNELLIGLVVGTVLYYLFSVFQIALPLIHFFNQPEVGILENSETWLNIVRQINYFLTLGVNLLVVLVIWIGLAFRRGNWQELLSASPKR